MQFDTEACAERMLNISEGNHLPLGRQSVLKRTDSLISQVDSESYSRQIVALAIAMWEHIEELRSSVFEEFADSQRE